MIKHLRNIVFIIASLIFYLLWILGGEIVYAKVVGRGIEKFTHKFSKIESVRCVHNKEQGKTLLLCYYSDRTTRISMEYCLPIVLLLAWQTSLFFDYRLTKKKALKLNFINFIIIYSLQILFPLLLYNISQSNIKSIGLFIGVQIFGFVVFFMIIKDSILIKHKFS